MPTLHMETETVQQVASQLRLASENLRIHAQNLNAMVVSIDWISSSKDEFLQDVQGLTRQLEANADVVAVLADRVDSEVLEWEQAASSLCGFSESGFPVSGGKFWYYSSLPVIPIKPIYAWLTVLPFITKIPDWVQNILYKFFPESAPVAFPNPAELEPQANSPQEDKPSFAEIGKDTSTEPERGASSSGDLAGTTKQEPSSEKPDDSIRNETSSDKVAEGAGQQNETQKKEIVPEVGQEYEISYNIPAVSQGTEFGSAACLPTSLSMVTAYYHNLDNENKFVSPKELVGMLDPGDGTSGVGVTFNKLDDDLQELGYKDFVVHQTDMSGLKTNLKDGPVVVNVKVGLVSSPERAIIEGNGYNHSIVVKGMSDTNVLINDPWSGKEIAMPVSQFEKMWNNGENWVHIFRP